MPSYSIYRDYTEDGVIGLNGKQFLLDNNDEPMEFPSRADAIQFLEDNGVDITDDDLMHIVASNDEAEKKEWEKGLKEAGYPGKL